MRISPSTPGFIPDTVKYPYAIAYTRRPAPPQALGQTVLDSEGTCAKVFQDVRSGKTTILIG